MALIFLNRVALPVFCLLLAGLVHNVNARSPIGCGVRLFAPLDQYAFLCKTILTNAATVSGTNAINFMPTQHYVDDNNDMVPESYCISQGPNACEPATPESIARFQDSMTNCFQLAYALGFRVFEITPRLDELYQRSWRNLIRLDPSMQYAGLTYQDILITPLINAINSLPPATIEVYFNIQGEMNGPLIAHPDKWSALGATTRTAIQATAKQIGVNLNFNQICGWCTGPNFAPNPAKPAEVFDYGAIQGLFSSVDFVGMSAYAPLWMAGDSYPFVTPEKIENSAWIAKDELKGFGVDLLALNQVAGKSIHYTEYGLGGGTCGEGKCPAANPTEVAFFPFFGLSALAYDPTLDPWSNPDNRNFRVEFYKNTIRALNVRRSWGVSHVYIWNHASFDVQGVYPGTSTKSGSWADQDIINMIQSWNKDGVVPV